MDVNTVVSTLIHHQDVICGVAFDRFSSFDLEALDRLQRIAHTPQSAFTWRLASNTFLVARESPKSYVIVCFKI